MRAISVAAVLHLPLLAQAQLSFNLWLPLEEFGAALNKPNATSRYPIDGFDVTKPYPYNEIADSVSIDGWALEFNASIMSAANSESETYVPSDGYTAGVSLKVVPPPELELRPGGGIRGVDKDWHVCATLIDYDKLPEATIERGKTDDGSCSHMFGEECVQALLSAYSTAASSTDPDSFDSFTGCSVPRQPPPACKKVFRDQGLLQTFGQLGLNETGFGVKNDYQWGTGGFKDKGNTTLYDLLGGRAHPVIISWGFDRNVTKDVQNVRYAGTSMRCVRAVNATAGSTAPSPPVAEVKDENEDKDGNQDGGQNQAPGNENDNNNNKGNGNTAGNLAGLGCLGTLFWGLTVALFVALTL